MGIELVKKSGQITLQKEMLRGDDGGYYTPSVDEDGNLTWTPSLEDMPEVAGANIKGDKGDKGDTGSVEWGDLTEEQIAALKGEKGDKGDDGYTPVKGVDYFDGEDGYTPVKGVDYFDGEDGKDGVDGKDGYTPVKGVDYFDGADGATGLSALTFSGTISRKIEGTNYYLAKTVSFNRTPVKGDYFFARYTTGDYTTGYTYYLAGFTIYNAYDEDNWRCTLGITVKLTGETGATGADGAAGEDGITPHIGDNGNWFIGETDTGVAAQGETGATGEAGADGEDGVTPHIGDNGNWFIGETDTGVAAAGTDGQNGADGADGYTPVKGTDYWTEADKAEIVAATVAALPVYDGEVV